MSRRSVRAPRPEQLESGPSGGGGTASRAEQLEPGGAEQVRGGIAMPGSLLTYPSRSPLFSRSSSGYFSFDSEPSSPLMTHSAATQTPSPAAQAIIHALRRISGQRDELFPVLHNPPPHGAASAGDMRAELYVAEELRRIGDDFNRLYFQEEGRNGERAQLLAQNEPAFMLWMGLLIGRLIQLLLRRR